MPRIAPRILRNYLFGRAVQPRGCILLKRNFHSTRSFAQIEPVPDESAPTQRPPQLTVPFRKQLKDEAKERKANPQKKRSYGESHPEWELTVGIEIHAQLNTPRKLFSSAASTIAAVPNTHVALFDLAVPGTQPIFQPEVLVPALRAALVLNCQIQEESTFDRKHYFHWDQPQGYQITQYYSPFAKSGYITLYKHDGIAEEDGESVRVAIKQVQMEQDTAKTIAQPGDIHLLDFNRVGLPLVEIITMPEIQHPSTAAALVRKVQTLLSAVDACVLGMESGGLRADVNVSVRRRGEKGSARSYAGVGGLGQRTEIKNLSSFKAVKDAIIAERDRQISVLEGGGVIEGETRGWTIGSSETRRLRSKEGEVDYRYMPDPDIPPLIIGKDLIQSLESSMGVLPDAEVETLRYNYGLTTKDSLSLVSLDEGNRVEYFYNVVGELSLLRKEAEIVELGRICSNWVLHELGGLIGDSAEDNALRLDGDGSCIIPAKELAALLNFLLAKKITGNSAKNVLASVLASAQHHGKDVDVQAVIEEGKMWFTPLSDEEYRALAESVMEERVVEQILKGQKGKVMLLVGRMMRSEEKGVSGRVDPKVAEKVILELVERRRGEKV